MLGTTLAGRYKIIKHIGGGGFGQTYLAQDILLPSKALCVVKQLHPQSNDPYTLQVAGRLFDTEAKILDQLGKHDQIPQLLAHFEEQKEFYLVQQYIDGNDLSQEMIPGKRWSEAQVIVLLQDILTTLSFVHQQNVIHRDLKPPNLIRRKQDGKVVIIDFGAVKLIRAASANIQGKTSLTVGIGTPGYMPNEQSNGKPRLSSDVYAVGMIGIQALTGLDPIRGQIPDDPQTGEIIWRDYAQVSPKLAAVLDKMVRYDCRQRYPSAMEALQALPQMQGTNTRRQFVKVAGFAGVGLVTAVMLSQVFKNQSSGTKSSRSLPDVQPGEKSLPLKTRTTTSRNPSLKTFDFDVVTVNSQGQITNRRRNSAQFFSEDLGNGISLEMVAIPGGRFLMGSPDSEKGRYDRESPQHSVTLQPFHMGKFTITQAQWRQVAALPQVKTFLNSDPSRFKGDNLPVEQVSWYEAIEFCARLSQKTGKEYRLPSEAEWEYACRAGTTTPFHFGETITPELVNYDGSRYPYGNAPKGTSRQKTTPVGSFQVANAFGLYDMHGNVWEWCADHWHDSYQGAPSDGSIWLSSNELFKGLLRGGAWGYIPEVCRSAHRDQTTLPDVRANLIGFRVVSSGV
jgi:formylglycine-generating enzyme required for sulfatase activity